MKKMYGNQDEKEMARELSPAEQKRHAQFEALSERMVQEGYRRQELTVSIVKANMFAVLFLIPLFVVGLGLFVVVNRDFELYLKGIRLILFIAVFLVLVVVHELIHGASWAAFTPNRFKDIEFGFMKQYLTPYCACKVPLSKGQYICGALMPLILLGILPMAAGILTGSLIVLLMGISMADTAAGDILIVRNILRYKSSAKEIVYMDHPTQAGGVIFER